MAKNKASSTQTSWDRKKSVRHQTNPFSFPFYPFLLSIYAPVWLVSNNFDLFPISEALRSCLVSLAITTISVLILTAIYRSGHKAALITSVGFLFLYSFTPVRHFLSTYGVPNPGKNALILIVVLFPILALGTFFLRSLNINVTKILNGFAIALLAIPATTLAKNEIRSGLHRTAAFSHPVHTNVHVQTTPTIVHIVLDAYSRSDALAKLYRYDNAPFIEALRRLGFTVSEEATSAYNQTILSMSSIFSMDYINAKLRSLSETTTSEKEIRVALHWAFQSSPVLNRFRAMGYKIADVESFYWGTQIERPDYVISDAQTKFGFSHFETTLIRYTPIYKLMNEFKSLDRKYTKVRYSLGRHDLSQLQRPYFLYNHILAPHAPFNISADGNFRKGDPMLGRGGGRDAKHPQDYETYRDGYVAKLAYANKQIVLKAESLIRDIPDPKVIIIHGDHGGGLYYDQTNTARSCLRERYGTFFAFYQSTDLPSVTFGKDVNIVNIYRQIFAQIFGFEDKPLPSRHYFATWENPGKPIPISDDELRVFGPACQPGLTN